jgi:hypothetical protein
MTRGRIAFTSSFLAVLAAICLLAFMFPVLLANDDRDALPALFVPVALALVAFAGLSAKCTSGSEAGQRTAVVCLAILAIFAVLTGFSIGILVLPIVALVALAVATTSLP